jgi:hypothetical protein
MAEATGLAAGMVALAGVTLSAEATPVQGSRRDHPRAALLPILQSLLAASIEAWGLIVLALVCGREATD